MATRELPARLLWRVARVVGTRVESARARTLVLDAPEWGGHRAGQHVDVRLRAADGYVAQRAYSIASAPEDRRLELTVERLDDGEVSPYLCDVLRPGDGLELRGPIGGHFVWDVADGGPVLLVAGGSGIVPLMAMLRHRAHADVATRARIRMHLLYSARAIDDVLYGDELQRLAADPGVDVRLTLTRRQPAAWTCGARRIDAAMLDTSGWPPAAAPRAYVCGPTALVESVASLLVAAGHDPTTVRTERFGPSGT